MVKVSLCVRAFRGFSFSSAIAAIAGYGWTVCHKICVVGGILRVSLYLCILHTHHTHILLHHAEATRSMDWKAFEENTAAKVYGS